MPKALTRLLALLSPWQLRAFSFLLVAIVGACDLATSYELSISIFYTIPVGVGTWYVGRRFGFLVCIVSAITWLAVDFASEHPFSHPAIPFWNASVRLGYFVIIAYLLDRLRGALDFQELLAQEDGLTGLLNARTFRQRCDAIFMLAKRHGRPLALGYLDLDGFKGVNDSFGHAVGDEVLKAVASALSKRLRASDLGSRLGGDEFAVLLPETDLAGARAFFTELHESLVKLAGASGWPVGFSVGVAVFHHARANPDAALRYADDLMYRVKNSGKNNILFEEYAR